MINPSAEPLRFEESSEGDTVALLRHALAQVRVTTGAWLAEHAEAFLATSSNQKREVSWLRLMHKDESIEIRREQLAEQCLEECSNHLRT